MNDKDCKCIFSGCAEDLKNIDTKRLIDRWLGLITKPNQTWEEIKSEQYTVKSLYFSYLIIPAALAALANFLRVSIIGFELPVVGFMRLGILQGLFQSVFLFLLGLGLVYVFSYVLHFVSKLKFLAGEGSQITALKIVGFASLINQAGSILSLIPALGQLLSLIFVFYFLYHLLIGIKTNSETDKAWLLMILFLVAAVIVGTLIVIPLSLLMSYGQVQ